MNVWLQVLILVAIASLSTAFFIWLSEKKHKHDRIKAIKKLLEECQNFDLKKMTINALRSKLIKLRENIRFCPHVSCEKLEIPDTWIQNCIHDIDLENAQKALKNLEENPMIDNYNEFQSCVDKKIPFSELKVTRQRVEELKRQSQIQDGLSRLEQNKREKEKIYEDLEKQGITEGDLYPEGDLE